MSALTIYGVPLTVLFGYLSGVANLPGYPPYIRDILKGTTKPERASWFIWSVLWLVAYFSQRAEGAVSSLWLTGVQTAGVLLIFALAIWKGEGGLARRDWACLVLAALGLVLWAVTRHAAYAICIVIFVDGIGVWLTATKAYQDPGSETLSAWAWSLTAGTFGVLAVGRSGWSVYAYPAYICAANFLVVMAILLGRRRAKP